MSFEIAMYCHDDVAVVAAATFLILHSKKQPRYWVHTSLAWRQAYNLVIMDDLICDYKDPVTNELNVTGFSHFKNFNNLTEAITPSVKRQDTSFSKSNFGP